MSNDWPSHPLLPTTFRSVVDRRRALFCQTTLCVAVFFIAVAPTLPWPQFSGDSEDLVVQTALQMRGGGPWWIPMLGSELRTKKPPLPAWITAAAARPATVAQLTSTDPAARESAYHWLAWEMRWPSLVAACLALAAVAWMARMIGGPAHVVPSVLICGSTFLFVRFIRSTTTDVHLMLWVTVTNAFFTAAMIERRRWLGCIGGGLALGLALMSKGPPALAETIVPFIVFLILRRAVGVIAWPRTGWLLPAVAGIGATLLIALPWPVSVFLRNPSTLKTWLAEIGREPGTTATHDPWYAYFVLLLYLMPWLPMVIAGCALAWRPMRRGKRLGLALLLAVTPVLIFNFFPDRKDRYLLPMAGPFSILAAHVVLLLLRASNRLPAIGRFLWISLWAVLLAIGAGLPIAAAIWLRRIDGSAWISPPIALIALTVAGGIILAGVSLRRRWRSSPVGAAAALILLSNMLFIHGWSGDAAGLSGMKPLADRIHIAMPDAAVVYYDPPPHAKPVTLDLDIYLDRPIPVVWKWPANDGRTQFVVLLRKDADPPPAVDGWQTAFDIISRKKHWYVLTPALQERIDPTAR